MCPIKRSWKEASLLPVIRVPSVLCHWSMCLIRTLKKRLYQSDSPGMLMISGILTERHLTVTRYCWIPWFAFWRCATQKNASTCEKNFLFFFSYSLSPDLLAALTQSLPVWPPSCFSLEPSGGWKHTGNSFHVMWKIYGSHRRKFRGSDVWSVTFKWRVGLSESVGSEGTKES